jgi:hypothetical protein
MQWCAFLVLLAIIAGTTVWSVVLYQNLPLADTVSWNEPLEFTVYCEPVDRFSYDRRWIACEDRNGFPASWVLTMMTIYLLSVNLWFTIAAGVTWKFIEALIYQAMDLSAFTGRSARFYEVITGALLGDIITTGLLGILIGILLAEYAKWHGFRRKETSVGVRWKYYGIGALLVAIYALSFLEAGGFNYGFFIAWLIQAVLVVFALPYIILDSDACDSRPGLEYHRLRWWWLVALILMGFSNFGYTYLFNGWYQAWASAYLFIIVMVIAIAIVGRSEAYTRRRAASPTMTAIEESE